MESKLHDLLKANKLDQTNIARIQQQYNLDKALGALYGAFIGDSLGSYCEFKSQSIIKSNIATIMQMPGQGTFKLTAGQLTDDSQLALQLGYALAQNTSDDKIIENIAKKYSQWLLSDPFDIGNTCKSAFQRICQILEKEKFNQQLLFDKIKQVNQNSQSNGSLMRITPLAIYYANKIRGKLENKNALQKLIENQINLTHSNKIIKDAGVTWVHLLQKLINRKDDKQLNSIYLNFKQQCKSNNMNQWLKQAEKEKLMIGSQKIGWAKIAWTYGIHQFRNIIHSTQDKKKIYKSIIQKVILQGGDTDTNACIVGGLIGSIVGFKNLPFEYLSKSLNPEMKLVHGRNNLYRPSNGLSICLKLFSKL